MKVSDLVARFGPEIMDQEASDVILVGLTPDNPTVASTLFPDQTRRLLKAIVEGGWAHTIEMKPN